jgi:zinc protease
MIRQLFIKIIGFLCGCLCLAANAQTIQYWKTAQGTPVYFVQSTNLPMLDVRVVFTAGSAYDQKLWGIASLTASTLNEGTRAHSADQIAETLEQTGAQYEADTDRDVTILALRTLSDPKYLKPALQIFNEMMSQANFPDQALERVKQQTLSAIRQQQQEPFSVAMDVFYRYLYPQHPYGHAVLGTPSTVPAITREQVQGFYQQFFCKANAKIILVGNLDRAGAEKIASQLISGLPDGKTPPVLTAATPITAASEQAIHFPSQQTSIITGQLGIDRHNSDFFPLMTGNYLIGQLPMASELFEQVRNQRGLAYNASSALLLLTYRGPFIVAMQTRTAEKNTALEVTRNILQQFVTQGPTPEKLELAKQNIIQHFPLTLATNSQLIGVLTQMAINQRPLNYLDTYRDHVNAVSADQVKLAFQNLIKPDKMLTVMVGQ